MNKPLSDPTQPYRGLIAGYTEAIRASDFKANIAFLLVMFMMGPLIWNYASLPRYLPLPFVFLPFPVVYFCLFMVLLPRFPKRGAQELPCCTRAHARGFRLHRRDRGLRSTS